jgi:hypothetical protein
MSKPGWIQVREVWNPFVDNIRAFRATCLELLAHPDITPEQLYEVHMKLVAVMEKYREMRAKVEAVRPKGYLYTGIKEI